VTPFRAALDPVPGSMWAETRVALTEACEGKGDEQQSLSRARLKRAVFSSLLYAGENEWFDSFLLVLFPV